MSVKKHNVLFSYLANQIYHIVYIYVWYIPVDVPYDVSYLYKGGYLNTTSIYNVRPNSKTFN